MSRIKMRKNTHDGSNSERSLKREQREELVLHKTVSLQRPVDGAINETGEHGASGCLAQLLTLPRDAFCGGRRSPRYPATQVAISFAKACITT